MLINNLDTFDVNRYIVKYTPSTIKVINTKTKKLITFNIQDEDTLEGKFNEETVFNGGKLIRKVENDDRIQRVQFASKVNVLIPCRYWGKDNPVYLDTDDLRNPALKIKVIDDVTCDILGNIKSTIRATTHDNPYYDYNILTEKEEIPFSSNSNITVMAIDNLPNALPVDTSKSFGEQLINNVLPYLISGEHSTLIENATILKDGKITENFSYLNKFIET